MARLRAVQPDEAPKLRKKSLVEAAESGTRLDLLIAMRDRIARTVNDPECPPRDLAALTRRLADVAKEIDSLRLAEQQEASESEVIDDEDFDSEAI